MGNNIVIKGDTHDIQTYRVRSYECSPETESGFRGSDIEVIYRAETIKHLFTPPQTHNELTANAKKTELLLYSLAEIAVQFDECFLSLTPKGVSK